MEVERLLKQDPHFRAKRKNSTIEDLLVRRARRLLLCSRARSLGVSALQAGRLTQELDFVHHSVRSQLDELKEEELKRLRRLLKAKHAVAEQRGQLEQTRREGPGGTLVAAEQRQLTTLALPELQDTPPTTGRCSSTLPT